MPELSPQRLHDLSPFADEDTLITQLLLAMLEEVVERHKDGVAAVFLEPLNRYEAYLSEYGWQSGRFVSRR